MKAGFSTGDVAFRDEVRAFLAEALTPELKAWSRRQAGVFADPALARIWHQVLYRKGWVAPSWPKEYGGPGWSAVQRYIFAVECGEAGAPTLPAMGLQMCGPVLMRYGTPEQKAFFLPRILSGEHYWCQGYSEPQSGSDLASLQTRAVREGDEYRVDGAKIWTTHAHEANWIFLLVRTRAEGKPQQGISFLLAPMDTPGITVRPILSISGAHEVNQVFLDDVRIPVSQRVGEENEGWSVAKYLLEFERGGGSYAARIRALLRQARHVASQERADDGGLLIDDEAFRRKIAVLETEMMAVEWTERRLVGEISYGRSVGSAASSIIKTQGAETLQRATELLVEAIGVYAVPVQQAAMEGEAGHNAAAIGPDYAATPTAKYFNSRAATVFGGSSEVQRNILARVALGL